jgi:hypothetical protein
MAYFFDASQIFFREGPILRTGDFVAFRERRDRILLRIKESRALWGVLLSPNIFQEKS